MTGLFRGKRMLRRNKTYYVRENGSWHTYEFLKKRQNNPKWRSAYLAAKRQRRRETIISMVILAVVLVVGVNLYNYYYSNSSENVSIQPSSQTSSLTASTDISSSDNVIEESSFDQQQALENDNVATDSEDFYYQQMKDALNRAQEYIDSFEDPEMKASVQTPEGAVNGVYSELLDTYAEDEMLIDSAYQRVMNGN